VVAPKVIYLDMDGVLVDFVGHVFRLFDAGVEEPHGLVKGWDGIEVALSEVLGREVTGSEMWGTIAEAGLEFWSTIPWCPWGKELLGMCSKMSDVVIMTTPTRDPMSSAGKQRWIEDNLDDPYGYAFSPRKHLMAHPGALLIDDADRNVERFARAGGMAYLFPQPWNSNRHRVYEDRLGEVRAMFSGINIAQGVMVKS
jgi:5'(3')-deoxyribonucleotidase